MLWEKKKINPTSFFFDFSISEESSSVPTGKGATKVSRTFSYLRNKMSSSKKSKVGTSCDLYSHEIPTGSRDEFSTSVCLHRVVFMCLPDFLFFFSSFCGGRIVCGVAGNSYMEYLSTSELKCI